MKKELEIVIKKEISPILKNIKDLEITDASQMQGATSTLSQVNKYADALKKDRLALTAPLEESLKLIRAKYTPTEKLLKEAVDTIKEKMGEYQMIQLKAQREAEAKIAAKVESGYIKIETAVQKMSEVDAPEAKVETEEGSVGFTTVRKFEVMDIVMLANASPLAVLPNDVFIRTQMKAGIELAGVRYFEELSVRNNR